MNGKENCHEDLGKWVSYYQVDQIHQSHECFVFLLYLACPLTHDPLDMKYGQCTSSDYLVVIFIYLFTFINSLNLTIAYLIKETLIPCQEPIH